MRRGTVLLVFLLIGTLALGCTSSKSPHPPNVLFILLDDAGYGDFGCNGNTDVQTPTIDRLSQQSTRLTRFYAQPVCTPTRACLMTGRDYMRTRAINTLYGNLMDPEEVTMAQVFRAAGYRTGIFGKWHLGDNYPMRTIDKGFEEAVTTRGGGMAHWFDRPGSSYFDPVLEHNGHSEKYHGYCNDIWFHEASRFISNHRNEPFFCYLATNLPHDPLIAPLDLWLPFHARGINEENAIIYGMMKNIDNDLSKLLKQLDDEGLAENTIIVFSSDNGPAMHLSEHVDRYNAGLRGEKKQVYEGGIRAPLFIRWPGHLTSGREIDRIGSMIDMMPTLTEACGVPGPANVRLDGKSLWPLITGSVASDQWPDRTLYFQWAGGGLPEPFKVAAARTQRWKLVDGKELYDEESDPAEANDVAAAHPEVVSDLRARYSMWFADVSSTRGFDLPPIYIGTPHENPSIINRRDWTIESKSGKELMGHWAVKIVNGGRYEVAVELRDTQHFPGEVHFQIGDVHLTQTLEREGLHVKFPPVEIPAQNGNLKIWYVNPNGPPEGVAEVRIKLTQPDHLKESSTRLSAAESAPSGDSKQARY